MMTREEALARIRMNPNMVPAGQDPDAFIAAMMAADAANSAPVTPPVPVSPADPAPVQAGVPIVAPPQMAPPMPQMATDFRNQAILAANQTKPPIEEPISGDMGQDDLMGAAEKDTIASAPPPAPPKLTRSPEEMRALMQDDIDMLAQAREKAVLSPDVQRYFDTASQRADAELADVDKDRKQQYWTSLAMAGAKMAQSTSPSFASALSEGLQSGLTGFNKARADAAEKKARLQTRKEDMILKRYEALKDEQDRAVNDINAGVKLTADRLTLANASQKNLVDAATAPYEVATAKSNAETAGVTARYAEERILADIAQSLSSVTSANASLINAQTGIQRLKREGTIPKDIADSFGEQLRVAQQMMSSADNAEDPSAAYASGVRTIESIYKNMATYGIPIPKPTGRIGKYNLKTGEVTY